MSKYRYGIATFKVFGIDPANGLALAGSEQDITEDIYRDTFDMTEEEGTETEHYSEMNTTPKVSFSEPGKETLAFDLMDTSVENFVAFLGGAIVEAAGAKTWNKPANAGAIERRLEIVTQDGYKMVVPRAKITALKNLQFRRNNIWTLKIKATPLVPQHSGLFAISITEPAP